MSDMTRYQTMEEEAFAKHSFFRRAGIFCATGDLAHKKNISRPASAGQTRQLDDPVIGVAKAGWTLDQLRARARDSVEHYAVGHGRF